MADSIVRLRVESQEYDAKLKRAAEGLTRYADECRKVGGTLEVVEKETLDYVRAIGQMETSSRTATGKLAEMKKTFTELSMQYMQMTDAEKASPVGKALASSLDQLKARIATTKSQLADVSKEMGEVSASGMNLSGVISQLGGQFGISGDLMSTLTTGTIAYTAAVGAAATAVVGAAKAFIEYNNELERMKQVASVTTGLQGPDADRMTDRASAISKVYGADFREVINAANTLMTQFGQTGDQAMQLISDGMQGMIMGDGPKLLSMIQQFAPSFRDAGISASQLVAIIHNSEGGIFTDQNMQAIVMGIRNIRLMTKQTSDALAKLGIDGQEMTRKLNDGSLTIFEAMKQVATAIERTGGSTQAAGEVMQAVFGRQATMAGSKLGEAIATLNTNLEETKRQTGQVGESFSELERANERLSKAMRETFGYDGWQKMSNGIKTELTDSLTGVYRVLGDISALFEKLGITGDSAFAKIGDSVTKVALAIQALPLAPTIAAMKWLANYGKSENGTGTASGGGGMTSGVQSAIQRAQGATFMQGMSSVKGSSGPQNSSSSVPEPTSPEDTSRTNNSPAKYVTGGIKGLKELSTDIQTTESMAELKAQLSGYQKALAGATNTADYLSAEQGISNTQKQIEAQPLAIRLGIDTDSAIQMQDDIAAELEKLDESLRGKFEPIKIEADTKGLKAGTAEAIAASKEFQSAAGAISSIGTALQTIEDPAAKVMGIVAQAIATVALTFAKSLEKTFTPWDWIAAAAAGAATMISTISAIKSATDGGYAEGGIVPGNYFSGDMLRTRDYGIESGELILNRSQQNNIADQLTTGRGDSRGGAAQPFVTGQSIFLGTNNYLKSSGQGQLVTTSMLRAKGINI